MTSADQVRTVIAQLERLSSERDFVGAGNLLVEFVLRSGPGVPVAQRESLLLAVRRAVARQFEIPEGLSYELTHADRYLAPAYRGDWEQDTLPQMVAFAYVLGATW